MSNIIRNFYDLIVWKKGHELVLGIYKITETFPEKEKDGVTSQIQRASTSITANIAEGFARFHFKDKVRFYYQARGSAAEVQNFLLIARDLKYINNEDCKKLGELANEVAKLINGLIKSTNNQLKN
ncbi:MAG: four helix bundle protein [Candidatus Moranbacteria bacterium]|nr:four helix bundle protein [Candidatus Moranbacteria bacterium]